MGTLGGYVFPVPKLLKLLTVFMLAALTAFVQLAVFAFAFRVTANSEWYPVQLTAFAFDGLFVLAVWRFLRRRPIFPVAALFVLASDAVLLFLAWLAREAPYRFPGWFVP